MFIYFGLGGVSHFQQAMICQQASKPREQNDRKQACISNVYINTWATVTPFFRKSFHSAESNPYWMKHLHVYSSVNTDWTFSFKRSQWFLPMFFCYIFGEYINKRILPEKLEIIQITTNTKICVELKSLQVRCNAHSSLCWTPRVDHWLFMPWACTLSCLHVAIYSVNLTN